MALFPTLPSDNFGHYCVSYEHVGQHGGADYQHCIRATRPATAKESEPLVQELERIGYRLRVIQRATRAMHDERKDVVDCVVKKAPIEFSKLSSTLPYANKYVDTGGGFCPKCQSDEIEVVCPAKVDDGYYAQRMKCYACDLEWIDVYTVTSVELPEDMKHD